MYKHLLAVADRYAMDRLKLMCAKKLWDDVSVDTVAETLSYAETYSCAELKSNCIAFFIDEENFMDAALTNGYAALVHKFPEIIDELKKKATSLKKRRAYTGVVRLAKMFDSCFVPFKLLYAEMKYRDAVYSETFYAGGHLWRIRCNLHGDADDKDGKAASFPDYLSIYLELMSNARGVKAIFEAFFMDKNGIQLGRILDCTDNGSDVSFVIGGETFPAHRAVLAARLPVFKAELFGSMVEASMSHITLEDITPATFKVFLRFIYTDALPQDDQSTIEMYTQLLAVANRYAMDRLKLMCAKKLWDDVSVVTVAETLSYAETYSCVELKSKCIAFIIDEENFMDVVLTNGYTALVHKFPEIIDELKKKATSLKKRKKAKN